MRSIYKDMENDDLIISLAKLYNRETKKAFKEAEKIVNELAARNIIADKEQFVKEWAK